MNKEQQNKAKDLFFQTDASKTEIAEALSVPRRTLHHWIRQNNWDIQKQCAGTMPVFIAENMYQVLSDYTQQFLSPERKGEPITAKEANTIYKLTLTITKLKSRVTLNETMEMFGHFVDSMNIQNPELAGKILPYIEHHLSAHAGHLRQFQPTDLSTRNQKLTPEQQQHEADLDRQDEAAWASEN